jgi:short-subunit dehydrogenase
MTRSHLFNLGTGETTVANLKGQWVLITGASSGFGVDYAHIFAKKQANLILTARRTAELQQLADTIRETYGVEVLVEPCDLSRWEGPRDLYEGIKKQGIEVEVLINNAGYGIYGDFTGTPWEKLDAMLRVDVMALTQLTSLYVQDMKRRDSGHILLVASIAAYQPSPTYAAYAAAKSYVLNLGEALNYELRKTRVKVSVLCPGVTATEFLQVAGQKVNFYQRLAMMRSRPVAELGVKALFKGIGSVVPGLMNKVSVVMTKLTPRWLQTRIVYLLMKE